MNIISVGIDLAKNVIAVPGVNDNGKPVLVKPKASRADRLAHTADLDANAQAAQDDAPAAA